MKVDEPAMKYQKVLIFIAGSLLIICNFMVKVSNIKEILPILTIDLKFLFKIQMELFTAIPCWTTMNWKFSSCSTYWTLYIITKLTILNFQKCIKKSSHVQSMRENFNWIYVKIAIFFQHIRELWWPKLPVSA